jgi:allophanate hydrolase subunit 2
MALQEAVKSITLPAAGDLSTKQFRLMGVNSSGQADTIAAANAKAIGVLQNKPNAAGREAEVAISGRLKIVAGTGGVAAGAEVEADANGAVVTAAGAGSHIVGIVLVAAAAGGLAEVLFGYRGIV